VGVEPTGNRRLSRTCRRRNQRRNCTDATLSGATLRSRRRAQSEPARTMAPQAPLSSRSVIGLLPRLVSKYLWRRLLRVAGWQWPQTVRRPVRCGFARKWANETGDGAGMFSTFKRPIWLFDDLRALNFVESVCVAGPTLQPRGCGRSPPAMQGARVPSQTRTQRLRSRHATFIRSVDGDGRALQRRRCCLRPTRPWRRAYRRCADIRISSDRK
jgi:hypothetical protein